MNQPIRPIAALLIALCLCFSARSQTIENIRSDRQGDKIVVQYDLKHDNPSERFMVRVYSSVDGYMDHLVMVKGDIGDRITPGDNKTIEWYARQELTQFSGEVIVEIRLFESKSSFYILNPYSRTAIKRGSELQINWSGGFSDDNVEIDLYADGVRLRSIASGVENSGDLKWLIPENLKPGTKYQVKLQSSEEANVNAYSGHFSIKRKVPLAFKIIPIVLVGGLVAYLSQPPDPGEEDLPSPPDPT